MHLIQLAVNRIIRFVFRLNTDVHITPYVIRFVGCSFRSYVDSRLLLSFFKVIKNQCPLFLVMKLTFCSSTRRNQLQIPMVHHLLNDSLHVRIAGLYNTIPTEIKHFSITPITFVIFTDEIFLALMP